MKYVLVFNPKAKRYSRALEATLVKQAARLLGGNGAVTYTTPQVEGGRGVMTSRILPVIATIATV